VLRGAKRRGEGRSLGEARVRVGSFDEKLAQGVCREKEMCGGCTGWVMVFQILGDLGLGTHFGRPGGLGRSEREVSIATR